MTIKGPPPSVWKRLLWRLLELDRPVPHHSPEELAALQARNYRWNYAVNLVDGVAFFLSMSFLSASTIVPLFVSKLSSSMVPVGLVAMLSQGGWFLPQIFSANWVERLPRRKPMVVNLGLFLERLPTWLLVPAAILAGSWPVIGLLLFLVFFAWRDLGGGFVGPAWQDLVARVIPVQRRGGYWGLTSALGTGLGLVAAALSTWLLTTYPFPTSFVFIFLLAAVAATVSWLFLALAREPAQEVRIPRSSQREYLSSLPGLLRVDGRFRRFLVGYGLLTLGGMGLGFVTVAAVRRFGVTDGTVGIYTGIMLLGQGLGSLLFGLLADRRGHKLSLEWSAGAFALAFLLAWLAPSATWFYAVYFLLGLGTGARLVSGILVVLEFAQPDRRPTYVGIANTIVGLLAMGGPLLGIRLADISYDLLFALSVATSLAALAVLHWRVREPRWADAAS